MNKIKLSCIGLFLSVGLLNAQSFDPNYTDGLYRYGENDNLSGTARYRALNGAMGALGGDLSSVIDNPAGASVFLHSEANLTFGVNSESLNTKEGGKNSSNKLGINQAGAVMVFNNYGGDKWKNFAIGLNYQKNNNVDESLDLNTDIRSANPFTKNNILKNIYYKEVGNSSLTNMSFSGNYDNKLYFGFGFNFHQFSINRLDEIGEFSNEYNKVYRYTKKDSPNIRQGNGFSLGLGLIGKVSKNVRLGLAYESPKWYSEIYESSAKYTIGHGADFYYVKVRDENVINSLNTSQKFTGSAAFIMGKRGLINVDYTYNDFNSAKFAPEEDFAGENSFINNYMKGTSTIKVGAETRIKDVSLRAGFRYQQSPFKEISLSGVKGTYQPYGDLTSFSLGIGYNMKDFYIDAAYSFGQRDRNYLLSNVYYDKRTDVKFNDLIPGATDYQNPDLQYAGVNALTVNTFAQAGNGLDEDGRGYAMSVKDITQKMSNFSLTLGLRF